MMILKDFIKELQQLPQDLIVAIYGNTSDPEITVSKEYPLGDYASPKCEYADVVLII